MSRTLRKDPIKLPPGEFIKFLWPYQRVRHPKFGDGFVLAVMRTGHNTLAHVNFPELGDMLSGFFDHKF
jgi:hypothetical protein